MLDRSHLAELRSIRSTISPYNIGDSLERALTIYAAVADPVANQQARSILESIRAFATGADFGWACFAHPIAINHKPDTRAMVQLGVLLFRLIELSYCFERVDEAAAFTFERSAPVRFYVNGIFHYVSSLFLLDYKANRRKRGLPYPGIAIKVLAPLGLTHLLEPVYGVLARPFGREFNYGETIRRNRNIQFVHGSLAPDDIRALVIDSDIFNPAQQARFLQCHWDLFNRITLLRLQMVSLLTSQQLDPADYTPQKLYGIQ